MRVMVLFSIHPLDKGSHVGEYVARAVQIIRDSGLEHELGPSGTTILGEWQEVFACIEACHAALAKDCERVSSLIKVDQANFPPGAIRGKVEATKGRLRGSAKTSGKPGSKGSTGTKASRRGRPL
jgi:uncharacterized protein (TIGR00106 family)